MPSPTELTSRRTKAAAAALARAWGYPRDITPLELQRGRWYTTADGIAWLMCGLWAGRSEDEWHLHGVGRPGTRGVLSAQWTALVRAEAQRLGAARVYAPLLGTQLGLARLLERVGWKPGDLGPVLEVA